MCGVCIWYVPPYGYRILVPVFQSFHHEPNISQLTFLNAYFAIQKSARSFIPRLMLSLSYIRKSNVLANADANGNGNDNDNVKMKIFYVSFSLFVSPLNFFLHHLSLFIIRYVLGVCGAVYCVITTNRITEDDGTIRPIVCVSIRPFHV